MLNWPLNFLSGLAVGWQASGGEVKAAIIGASATIAAAFAGFGAVVLQMRSQGRQARTAIIEAERRKLKAGMYEDSVSICRSLADASIDLSSQLRLMTMQLEVASRAYAVGIGFQMPSTRFPELSASYTDFSDATLRIIFLVENRRVIDPRVVIFRDAFSSILHDTRDLMFSQFVVNVVPLLPVEGPNGLLYPYNPPALEGVRSVSALTDQFIGSLDDAVAYTEDFLVEMQNLLLGDLFGTQVNRRKPIDPTQKVICLDHAEALEIWFRRETAWGQNCQRVESETRARFAIEHPNHID